MLREATNIWGKSLVDRKTQLERNKLKYDLLLQRLKVVNFSV